jgi:hypothetical protein
MSSSKDAYASTVNQRAVVLEHTLQVIERELAHPMDAVERAAVTVALETFGGDWAYYERKQVQPW